MGLARLRGRVTITRGKAAKAALFTAMAMLLISGIAFAAQTNESKGPGGYGWQQVYGGNDATDWERLTASADRDTYDYNFKPIEIAVRQENYWSSDCGWWYVDAGRTVSVRIIDDSGVKVYGPTSYVTLSTSGLKNLSVTWPAAQPGQWEVIATESTGAAKMAAFYIYVRGQLTPGTPTVNQSWAVGKNSQVAVELRDRSGGNLVQGNRQDAGSNNVAPTVEAIITGPGGTQVVSMSDGNNDGNWTGDFVPSATGNHKVIIKASDGHKYWVDGRSSTTISIGGDFPASFEGINILKVLGFLFMSGTIIRWRMD